MREDEPFRVEVTEGSHARVFNIQPLGNARYEIFIEEDSIGTIILDETDHARCESQGCELDMHLLHTIREQIQFHQQWKQSH